MGSSGRGGAGVGGCAGLGVGGIGSAGGVSSNVTTGGCDGNVGDRAADSGECGREEGRGDPCLLDARELARLGGGVTFCDVDSFASFAFFAAFSLAALAAREGEGSFLEERRVPLPSFITQFHVSQFDSSEHGCKRITIFCSNMYIHNICKTGGLRACRLRVSVRK